MPSYRDYSDNPFEKYRYSKRPQSRRKLLQLVGGLIFVALCVFFWVSPLKRSGNSPHVCPTFSPHSNVLRGRENATFVMLVRNRELDDTLSSIRQIEDRFNRNFHYPWVFLNDEPFTNDFKKYTSGMASGKTEYGLIPKEHWSVPEHIDMDRVEKVMKKMREDNVIYGDSLSYSTFHYLANKSDVFEFMRVNNKTYSFTLSLPEYQATIPTLWKETQAFAKNHPEAIVEGNSIDFLVDNHKGLQGDYNLCHFWSNFEIGDMRFWRSDAYRNYFDHLDKAGGFFYERVGDAPVHSIAAALFLRKENIHWFEDMGYWHVPWGHCPQNEELHSGGKCLCDRSKSFDREGYSCWPKWAKMMGLE